MNWIDLTIIVAVVVFLTYCALTSRKYSNTVAGFLSANCCAGRYLICIAQTEAGLGAISIIAGFGRYFLGTMSLPITILISMSGWVYYRYRQTRALTLAQFFEMRYSRKFRIFAGILIWVSGILNFGIFPRVAARFFINFCGSQFVPGFLSYVIFLICNNE